MSNGGHQYDWSTRGSVDTGTISQGYDRGIGGSPIMRRMQMIKSLQDKKDASRNKALISGAKAGMKVLKEDSGRVTAMMTKEGRERYKGAKGFFDWMTTDAKTQADAIKAGRDAPWSTEERKLIESQTGIKSGVKKGYATLDKYMGGMLPGGTSPFYKGYDKGPPPGSSFRDYNVPHEYEGMDPELAFQEQMDELSLHGDDLKIDTSIYEEIEGPAWDAPARPDAPIDPKAVERARYASGVEQDIFPQGTTIEDMWAGEERIVAPQKPELPIPSEVEPESMSNLKTQEITDPEMLPTDPKWQDRMRYEMGVEEEIFPQGTTIEDMSAGEDRIVPKPTPVRPDIPIPSEEAELMGDMETIEIIPYDGTSPDDPLRLQRDHWKRKGVDLEQIFEGYDIQGVTPEVQGIDIEGQDDFGALGLTKENIDTAFADIFGGAGDVATEAGGALATEAGETVATKAGELGLREIGSEVGSALLDEAGGALATEATKEATKEASKCAMASAVGPGMDILSLFDEKERNIGSVTGKGLKAFGASQGWNPVGWASYGVGTLLDMLT